jgi:polysaccharide export outer membrane protein
MLKHARCAYLVMAVLLVSGATSALAQTPSKTGGPAAAGSPASGPSIAVAPDFVIGPEDVLGVLFWREADMSGDVTVRPDGQITLPLIGEIHAAGLRPDELRELLQKAGAKFLTDANVTVVMRQSNSRKVFILGEVMMPGTFLLTGPRNVMQLIALAGGLSDFADGKDISILRGAKAFKFNYEEVKRGRKLDQNILLQPGDTIVVP